MTDAARPHLLIVGVTTRAMAASAAAAGYRVTAVDAFGDLDLRAVAQVLTISGPLGGRFDPHAAVAAGAAVPADLVAYTSNLENYPRAVACLAAGRKLLGNPPEALARVRNPIALMRALRRNGFPTPESRASPPTDSKRRWLLKTRRSGGGHGASLWHRGSPVLRSKYVQERIEGVPGSVVFAANGRDSVVLGLSRQLVGDVRFGAHGFRYCGSVLAGSGKPLFANQDGLLRLAEAMAGAVTQEFGLVGLNGIDFIARGGVPYPIEVNPRYAASLELVERAQRLSLFEVHASACRGKLPEPLALPPITHGKAIVFARQNLLLGDTRSWLGQRADVPHPGARIESGHPICTVFGQASGLSRCVQQLVRQAGSVYRASRRLRKRAA